MKREIIIKQSPPGICMSIATAFAICLLCSNLIQSKEITHHIDLSSRHTSVQTIQDENGTDFSHVSIDGCYSLCCKDSSSIPVLQLRIQIPIDAVIDKIRLNNAEYSLPVKLDYPLIKDKSLVSVDDLKNNDKINSENNIAIGENPVLETTYIVNGNKRVASILIPAAIYESETRNLSFLKDADISVAYSNSPDAIKDFTIINAPESYLDRECEKDYVEIINEESSNSSQKISEAHSMQNASSCIVHSSKRYYIITPKALKESLSDLVSWKRQKGYTVILKTVEELMELNINDPEMLVLDPDKEFKIREWLKEEYKTHGTFNLLIVGDSRTSAPIRKFRNHDPISDETNPKHIWYEWYDGENFIPTDAYFSDMTSKFTLNEQIDGHLSVNYHSLKYSPQVPIGRILAQSPYEIENYIKKLLVYEINPGLGDNSYLDRGFVCRQYDFCIPKRLPSILGPLKNLKDSTVLLDSIGLVHFTNSRPTGKQVIEGMKECGIISLQGHGGPTTIATSGKSGDNGEWRSFRYIQPLSSYKASETKHDYLESGNGFDNLNNRFKPGIFYTFSCDVAPFDIMRDYNLGIFNAPCNMAAGYTVAGDFGGIAFIGNTRQGWTSQSRMENAFGEAIYKNMSIGNALKSSKSSGGLYNQLVQNLIGDPDIRVWIGSPKTTSYIPALLPGILDIQGDFTDSTTIALYDGEEKSEFYYLTNELFSNFSIPINTKNEFDKDFMVTIFNTEKLPYSKLFASGVNLSSSKKYFFSTGKIGDNNNVENNLYSYYVEEGGLLDLYCTNKFTSKKAFDILNGGNVKISAFKEVELEGDKIENGGTMTVEAGQVLLKPGFSVDKGGSLTINIKK